MKRILTFAFIAILIYGISCHEDDFDIIPAITQEGANTFGCLIDWKLLVPKDGKGGLGGQGADGLLVTNIKKDSLLMNAFLLPYFSIQASNSLDKGGDYMYIYIPSLESPGIYPINASNGYKGIDSPPHPHVFANHYHPDYKRYLSYYNSGEITITRFDTVNTIISGVFSLKMVDEETETDTIEVRDGRFDINWSTLNCGKSPWHFPCP